MSAISLVAIGFFAGLVTWPVMTWLRNQYEAWLDRRFGKDEPDIDWEN